MKQDQTNRIFFSLHGKYTGRDYVPVQLRCLSSPAAIPLAVVKEFMYHRIILPLLVYKTSQRRLLKKCPPSRGVEDYTFSIRIYIPFPFFNSNVNLTDHLLCLRFIFIEIFIKYFESAGLQHLLKMTPPPKQLKNSCRQFICSHFSHPFSQPAPRYQFSSQIKEYILIKSITKVAQSGLAIIKP